MKKVAIIFTVFNRKDVTIEGLCKLFPIINSKTDCNFELFMTDDGCTDGTSEAVRAQFPSVHIVEGDGSLYWSGGMRKAWQAASDFADFDYYIWYNDDAELYDDALDILFEPIEKFGDSVIVCGAFCDYDGNVSYGGRGKDEVILKPEYGLFKEIFLMNGNFTLIPSSVFKTLGNILNIYRHSMGDWDYGCRALSRGIKVVLTDKYVGVTSRHDSRIAKPFQNKFSFIERLKLLYSPMFDPRITWYFNYNNISIFKALKTFFIEHIYVLFPFVAKTIRKIQGK